MTTCMTEVIAHAHRSNAAKIAYFDGQSSALVLSQRIVSMAHTRTPPSECSFGERPSRFATQGTINTRTSLMVECRLGVCVKKVCSHEQEVLHVGRCITH